MNTHIEDGKTGRRVGGIALRLALLLVLAFSPLPVFSQSLTPIYNLRRGTNTLYGSNWIALVTRPNQTNGTEKYTLDDIASFMALEAGGLPLSTLLTVSNFLHTNLTANIETRVLTNSGTGFNLTLRPVDSDDSPLTIRAAAGQDTWLIDVLDSSGTRLFGVSEEGVLSGARLGASSTVGQVFTATDTEGRGSWQAAAAGEVTTAQLNNASNVLYSTETTRNAAVSNALVALLVTYDTTTSNGLFSVETTRNAAVSNALVTLLVANDTTTSNGLFSVETTRNAAVSNALVTLLVANDTTTSNGLFSVETTRNAAVSNALVTLLVANDTTTSNGLFSVETTRNAAVSNALVTLINLKVDIESGNANNLTLNSVVTVNSNLVFTPRPFVLGNTNWFADGGRGMRFTNVHVAVGLTNFYPTNLTIGQTVVWYIQVGIGSTAGLPWAVASDYLSGRIEGLASNAVNEVTITRTAFGTNVSVKTKEFTLGAGYKTELVTNLATMTITSQTTQRYTNYADGNITLNASTDLTANYTNAVAGNRSITFSTPVIGTSGSLALVSDGSARTLPILSASSTITWMSTNDTATATNILTTASKRSIFAWRVGMGTDGVTTNISCWVKNQTP